MLLLGAIFLALVSGQFSGNGFKSSLISEQRFWKPSNFHFSPAIGRQLPFPDKNNFENKNSNFGQFIFPHNIYDVINSHAKNLAFRKDISDFWEEKKPMPKEHRVEPKNDKVLQNMTKKYEIFKNSTELKNITEIGDATDGLMVYENELISALPLMDEVRLRRSNTGGKDYDSCKITEVDPDGDCISGKAGVDYPVYNTVPDTGFTCPKPGYYSDQSTQCQVSVQGNVGPVNLSKFII